MPPVPTAGPTRRRVLASLASVAGAASLSGCTATWNQTGATVVVLHSAATAPTSVRVVVTPTDADDPHTDRTLDLSPGQTVEAVNNSKLPTNDAYAVDVTVSGGPSETFDWADPQVHLSPLWVLVDDSNNVTFLLQAG